MTQTRIPRSAFLTRSAAAMAAAGSFPRLAEAASRTGSPASITYVYAGSPQKDLPLVQNAINAITTKKINTSVTLKLMDWGTYDQKMKLDFAAGQAGDIVFTAPWINNYYQLVANGDLLALDELLPKYAPNLWHSMPPATWNAARVQGKIYAIINQQMFPKFWGALIRKDLAQKYHLDVAALRTYGDLEPFLATIKAKEPGVTPVWSNSQGQPAFSDDSLRRFPAYALDELAPGGVSVLANDKSLKVFCEFETPEYMKMAQLAYRWHQMGYMTKDPLPESEAVAAFKAGKYAIVMDQARPGEIGKVEDAYGYDFVEKSFIQPVLNTAAVTATMSAIPRSSANPVQAMQFLDLLNSDKQVYNLITHGILGRDYVVVDKARGVIGFPKGLNTSNDPYLPNTDWEFGNQFNAYYSTESEVGAWDLQRKINATAYPAVYLGFAPVFDAIKTQVAQLTAIETQYTRSISGGLVDPAVQVPKFIQALKAAGVDQVIAEVQKQINAWARTNKAK